MIHSSEDARGRPTIRQMTSLWWNSDRQRCDCTNFHLEGRPHDGGAIDDCGGIREIGRSRRAV